MRFLTGQCGSTGGFDRTAGSLETSGPKRPLSANGVLEDSGTVGRFSAVFSSFQQIQKVFVVCVPFEVCPRFSVLFGNP